MKIKKRPPFFYKVIRISNRPFRRCLFRFMMRYAENSYATCLLSMMLIPSPANTTPMKHKMLIGYNKSVNESP